MNINNRLANLVTATMKDTKCQIRIQGRLSEPSSIRNGVRQRVFTHLLVAGDASRNITGNIYIYMYMTYYRMLPTAYQEAVHKLETSARDLHLKIDAVVLNIWQ